MNIPALKNWMKDNHWTLDFENDLKIGFTQKGYFRDYNKKTWSYVQGHLDTVIKLVSSNDKKEIS